MKRIGFIKRLLVGGVIGSLPVTSSVLAAPTEESIALGESVKIIGGMVPFYSRQMAGGNAAVTSVNVVSNIKEVSVIVEGKGFFVGEKLVKRHEGRLYTLIVTKESSFGDATSNISLILEPQAGTGIFVASPDMLSAGKHLFRIK